MQKSLYQHCYKEMMKLCYRYTNDVEISASIYNELDDFRKLSLAINVLRGKSKGTSA